MIMQGTQHQWRIAPHRLGVNVRTKGNHQLQEITVIDQCRMHEARNPVRSSVTGIHVRTRFKEQPTETDVSGEGGGHRQRVSRHILHGFQVAITVYRVHPPVRAGVDQRGWCVQVIPDGANPDHPGFHHQVADAAAAVARGEVRLP